MLYALYASLRQRFSCRKLALSASARLRVKFMHHCYHCGRTIEDATKSLAVMVVYSAQEGRSGDSNRGFGPLVLKSCLNQP
jgi:hypothetical protein